MPWIRAAGNPRSRTPASGGRAAAARASLAWLSALALGSALGCGGDAKRPIRPEYDLHDPSACRRTEAVCTVAASRDTTQVPALIEMLDDDDPAVRLTAGATLKSVTGRDTGYRASAPPGERQRQQAAWRAWWAARGKAAPASSGAIPGAPRYTGSAPHAGRP